ncbi:MAG: isoprenylcysteine carboxylmethyltransferase family protein [Patescibacteria group bacterium]
MITENINYYFLITVNAIVAICTLSLTIFIIENFITAKKDKSIRKQKKSIVETFSMSCFFVLIYLLYRFHIGAFNIEDYYYQLSILGVTFVIFGTTINIWGRMSLGLNWGNQVRIYDTHNLVEDGPYKYVRHPLYASLILICYGIALVYTNYLIFLANTIIFIPAMIYRAKQEEKLLVETFGEYKEYMSRVGMLFPNMFYVRKTN